MEKSGVQNLKLGLFVIIGVTLFISGVYFIGERQSLFGSSNVIHAVFNNVNGLKPGNNVRFSGINVGTVKDIKIINDTVIIVDISLKKDIIRHIKKDAQAVVTADGLVGNMIVNIIPGSVSHSPLISGDTIQSFSRVRTDEMLNTLSVTNENAALLTAELLKITKDISGGKGLVGALIKDSTLIKDLHLILDNIRKTTEESVLAVKNMDKLIVSLDNKNNVLGMVKDTAIATQIKRIVTNIEQSSQQIETVIENLNIAVSNTNATITNIKDGKGAINYLSNDVQLVKKIENTVSNLDSSMIQINAAGIKLNENLEALKHNWLLRGYFKNMEKEKEKEK